MTNSYCKPESSYRQKGVIDGVSYSSRGVHDQTKVIAGHLYTTALDAAKQGVRFKYAHLQASSLENLIRSKTVAEKELALLRAKALDSESDSDRPDPPYHLTPRLPTQDTSTGPANNDNSKRLPQQDERGAISSDQAVQAVDDEISARPPKDDDVSDLWLQACEDKVVFALAKGTPLERMKDFAFVSVACHRIIWF